MKLNIPVRSLSNITWLMAVTISSVLAIFIFTYVGFRNETIYTVLHAALNIIVIGFFHLFLIVKASKQPTHFFRKVRRFNRYALTYFVTICYGFLINPLRDFMADRGWLTISFSQQIITVLLGSIVLDTVIISVHNLVIMYKLNSTAEVENEKLKAANAEAGYLLLRQQIHPHFLFNALSILKTLYKNDPPSGDSYMAHLANFLRASIANPSDKPVSVQDELRLCHDYIVMQKIRFGEALRYHVDSTLDGEEGLIPPFSLQPLLENAIKHNEVTESHPLQIRLYAENGYIIAENNIQPKQNPGASSGSGLANLRKRYALIFGEEVIIKQENNLFAVFLKIGKHEDHNH